MRRHRKTLALAAAALTASLAGLGGSAGAAAAASAPVILNSYAGLAFVCNGNGVCTPGAGDVGVLYAAGIEGTEDGLLAGTITVASGSLPRGLQLSGSNGLYQITGTPTAAGTYNFTLQDTDQGVSGTQPFFITVGTGTADNLVDTSAVEEEFKAGGPEVLDVRGFDPNAGATYTVYVTSTGQEIATTTEDDNGQLSVSGDAVPDTYKGVTIKDSLGSSVSLPVKVVERKY